MNGHWSAPDFLGRSNTAGGRGSTPLGTLMLAPSAPEQQQQQERSSSGNWQQQQQQEQMQRSKSWQYGGVRAGVGGPGGLLPTGAAALDAGFIMGGPGAFPVNLWG